MTKDWTGFLAAALRLVDLHDNARSPGGAPACAMAAGWTWRCSCWAILTSVI